MLVQLLSSPTNTCHRPARWEAGCDMADAFLVFIQLYFYAVFCLPVGVPPGEPDPYLSQVAPPAPLYYIQSSGTQLPAADDGEPTNLTLRLMADPEIRRSLEKLEALVVEQMSRVDQSADKGRARWRCSTRGSVG
ncbi:MAG: hypothetical protein R3B96_10640 [Pirellulaceae bacterium]